MVSTNSRRRAKTQVAELDQGKVKSYQVAPADFGLSEEDPAGLKGGEPAVNAARFLATLQGEKGASRTASLMTAAAGLVVVGKAASLREGAVLATDALDGGRALAILERLKGLAGKA